MEVALEIRMHNTIPPPFSRQFPFSRADNHIKGPSVLQASDPLYRLLPNDLTLVGANVNSKMILSQTHQITHLPPLK
jgi:hypothetical protein